MPKRLFIIGLVLQSDEAAEMSRHSKGRAMSPGVGFVSQLLHRNGLRQMSGITHLTPRQVALLQVLDGGKVCPPMSWSDEADDDMTDLAVKHFVIFRVPIKLASDLGVIRFAHITADGQKWLDDFRTRNNLS